MEHSIPATRCGVALLLIILSASPRATSAQIQPPRVLDEPATVIAHLPLDGVVVSGIHLRQLGGKKYLYLETSGKPGIMVVNITKAKKPSVVKDVDLPKDVRTDSLEMIGHGLALTETSNAQSAPAVPRTINILDVSHPEHPRVIQTFTGVTAMAISFDYNLLFFANNEGLWILKQQWAQPPVYACGSSSALIPNPNCE
ncbi:MAG TPA: hypothetical protein VED66_00525 [Candidatus Sulfotelmatobacter sp.]|nr:hypothetical protein [Candidatus Sulfotelmatobacter sp.]